MLYTAVLPLTQADVMICPQHPRELIFFQPFSQSDKVRQSQAVTCTFSFHSSYLEK